MQLDYEVLKVLPDNYKSFFTKQTKYNQDIAQNALQW